MTTSIPRVATDNSSPESSHQFSPKAPSSNGDGIAMQSANHSINSPSQSSAFHHQHHHHEHHQPTPGDQQQSDQDREYLESVCDSFRQYATFMRCARFGHSSRIQALPEAQKEYLPKSMVPGSLEATERETIMQDSELRNQFFFDTMLRHAGLPNSQDIASPQRAPNSPENDKSPTSPQIAWSTEESFDKVQSVLKSLSRDWSKEGQAERQMCYQPILDGIRKHAPLAEAGTGPFMRILVPGAGMGRLALELYAMGYEVQGNEFSLHMLLASDFILNGCNAQNPYGISPWLGSTRNVCRSLDPIRIVHVPDIDPASVMHNSQHQEQNQQHPGKMASPDFSMAAGEFVSIYSKPKEHGKWHGIASCFFLDTAPNLVEYLQVIWDALDENGVLVNLGPLLYHWSGPPFRPDDGKFDNYLSKNSNLDQRYLDSIDMCWEDVREVLWRVGFDVLEERLGVKARYTADSRSFMNSDYRCIYFVARKNITRRNQSDASEHTT